MRRAVWAPLVVLAGAVGACGYGGRGAESVPETDCEAAEGPLAQTATAARLAGEYAFTLVATGGQKSGVAVRGTLSLRSQPEELRTLPSPSGEPYPGVTIPLVGTLDVPLDSVGAYTPGSLLSTDASAPGVAVLQREGEITLRLGAEANRRGVFTFDGPYTVLWVDEIDDDRFSGHWTSGAMRTVAEGHFCARRLG